MQNRDAGPVKVDIGSERLLGTFFFGLQSLLTLGTCGVVATVPSYHGASRAQGELVLLAPLVLGGILSVAAAVNLGIAMFRSRHQGPVPTWLKLMSGITVLQPVAVIVGGIMYLARY